MRLAFVSKPSTQPLIRVLFTQPSLSTCVYLLYLCKPSYIHLPLFATLAFAFTMSAHLAIRREIRDLSEWELRETRWAFHLLRQAPGLYK